MESYKKKIELSAKHDHDINIPAPAGLSFLGYQKAGVAYAVEMGSAIIADEPGLGKTIQAIGISNMIDEIKKVLIICPASLKINWSREWQKWDTKNLNVGIVKNGDPKSWIAGADVIIINFNLVSKHLDQIHAQMWDLLVIDEAHNLRNQKSKRTSHILGLKDKNGSYTVQPIPAKRLIPMTGTPIVNRPIELWPLIHAVNPRHFNNFFAYAKRYCNAQNTGYGWNFKGASNLEELQAELRSHCLIRRTKTEVLKDLPSKTRQIIPIDNEFIVNKETKSLKKITDTMEKLEADKILAFLNDDLKAYEKAVKKLKEVTHTSFQEMARIRHQTALDKVPHVVEIVTEALEQGKVILFAHHKDVIKAYKEAFGDAAVVVDGSTANVDRQAAADRFQNDPTCTLFIGSIQAAGVGFTLTASSHVIFAEIDWVPGNLAQAEDRAHRIGQKSNVLVWHLVIDGSLDSRMAEIVVEKMNVIERAMDGEMNTMDVVISDNAPKSIEGDSIDDPGIAGAEIIQSIEMPAFQVIDHEEVTAWVSDVKKRAEISKKYNTVQRANERAAERGFGAEAEQMSVDAINAVHQNLIMIAAVCDGAIQRDGMGFNGVDSKVGNALASLPQLSALQAAYARGMLQKYVGQIGKDAVAAMYDKGTVDCKAA